MEDGPPFPAGSAFVPGETVWFSALLDGYTVKDKKVKLKYEFQVTDPNGILLEKPDTGAIDTDVTPNDKDWTPKIREDFIVPSFAASGQYKVRITVTDELAPNADPISTEATFPVRGKEVAPADSLSVRNLGFYRSEGEGFPLKVAAYRPGDELWVRFDLTGYKLGDGNRVDVEYEVSILDSEGKVLFTQPQPATETSESFYPQRYVPCQFSLTVQPGTSTADYAVKIAAKDKVGGQTANQVAKFRVE